MSDNIDPDLLAKAQKVTAHRAKTVIDHLIKHGSITTEELKNDYGYNHPPRAIRDVREEGIPIDTFRVPSKGNGRKIAAYKFGDPSKIENDKLGGRQTFSKEFKASLIDKYGERCGISNQPYKSKYLQIDHRIPYQVAGDGDALNRDINDYMLLSGAAQRQKSWDCEHCENVNSKNIELCKTCYWASPENYTHIALKPEKRVDLIFGENDKEIHGALDEIAKENHSSIQESIKEILRNHIKR